MDRFLQNMENLLLENIIPYFHKNNQKMAISYGNKKKQMHLKLFIYFAEFSFTTWISR